MNNPALKVDFLFKLGYFDRESKPKSKYLSIYLSIIIKFYEKNHSNKIISLLLLAMRGMMR